MNFIAALARRIAYALAARRFRKVEAAGGTSYRDSDLIYAAFNRCKCGAGLAYPRGCGGWHYWACSDLLTGRAAATDPNDAWAHSPRLPFVAYEIKSEQQPSANGATTRRPDVDVRLAP